MSKEESTQDKWPCPVEYRGIKLKEIAAVMNEYKITMAEYMSDRQKYLEGCGLIKPETVTVNKTEYNLQEQVVDQLKAELAESEAEGILLMEELAEMKAKYEEAEKKRQKAAEMYAEK